MLFRAGVPRHAIIKKFAGEDISTVEDFISVISKLSRGARVPLEYISHADRHRRKVLIVLYVLIFHVSQINSTVNPFMIHACSFYASC